MNIKIMILDAIRSIMSPLKRWVKRNRCVKRGQKVKIQYGAEISNSIFGDNVFIAHHASCVDSKIGNYTSIGRYTKVRCAEIGKYCSISWDTTIGAVAHPLTKISTCALTYKAEYHLIEKDKPYHQERVIVGNDVWIGCNAVIVSGVRIGDGAVIGAGAVVTEDVPPYAIVAGVPARKIRYRVDEALIKRLLILKWWDWDESNLKENLELFSEDIDENIVSQLEIYKRTHIK